MDWAERLPATPEPEPEPEPTRVTRWAWAEIDMAAVAGNVRHVREVVAPAAVWAVVKADGYGHGAVRIARVALDQGARGLCVALAEEGLELRRAGIDAPILILSEQPPEQYPAIVAAGLTPTLYTVAAVRGVAAAVRAAATKPAAAQRSVAVHLKIDTGMHRVGARPDDAVALATEIAAEGCLDLEGVFTHLATADEPASTSINEQLARFDAVLRDLANAGHRPAIVHAANSAAALASPGSRYDAVRLGIGLYGIEPGPAMRPWCTHLRPAMSLRARVSLVKRVERGGGVSYGLRSVLERSTTLATVPLGYADGVPRRLFGTGGVVLIHGRRLPIVGVVTMDQLVVDCEALPDGVEVRTGDEVVLIGTQEGEAGSDAISAEEWADRLGTIGYEIVCGISRRIERRAV